LKKAKRLVPACLLFFCAAVPPADAKGAGREIEMVVSVDWEGEELAEDNLAAFRAFRDKNPEIRITHFLNAAYFTKPGADAAGVVRAVRSVMREGDQLGLHIHGWKSLFEKAGTAYRSSPGFWNYAGPGDCSLEKGEDCGHEVPINSYSVDELRRVIRYSLDVLAGNGFRGVEVFRAGGWVAAPNVLEAAAVEGLSGDSSGVTVPLLAREIGGTPLYISLGGLWPGLDQGSGPYRIETPAGPITEFPDNMALADYVSGEEVYSMYRRVALQGGDGPLYVHFGFHLETADRFVNRVHTAVFRIREDAGTRGFRFKPATLSETRTR